MKSNRLFEPAPDAIDRLVAAHPFAQLVSVDGDRPVCTPLPLLLERRGGEACLIGHFARANPQVALLRRQPRALAVFMGAQGYVSPSWMRDRTQAPTWNYETVHFDVEVAFAEGEGAPHDALERLVAHMEQGRPGAWSSRDMGPRYEQLAKAVIAFRARIVATQAKFKLGQNERADVFEDILAGLERSGSFELLEAMRREAPPFVGATSVAIGIPQEHRD
jgi:transcriptional regulator